MYCSVHFNNGIVNYTICKMYKMFQTIEWIFIRPQSILQSIVLFWNFNGQYGFVTFFHYTVVTVKAASFCRNNKILDMPDRVLIPLCSSWIYLHRVRRGNFLNKNNDNTKCFEDNHFNLLYIVLFHYFLKMISWWWSCYRSAQYVGRVEICSLEPLSPAFPCRSSR